MLQIGVQTRNIVDDKCPEEGFKALKNAGFSCADFSLNGYLKNSDLYACQKNSFFDQSVEELEAFFEPHKKGGEAAGIRINQMHMPYPVYVPNADRKLNEYLFQEVAPKSLHICKYFNCSYIVLHGFKLARFVGSEEAEWQQTEKLIHSLAPLAKELGITICVENLYDNIGGHLVEGPCCNARKVVERIDRMNEQYQAEILGFCLDTGHANLVGLEMEQFIGVLGKRLKVLHIHDNDGISDLHQIPYTFAKTRENTASTDWDGFIRGLRSIKFDKVLSFETAPVLTAFPEEMRMDALQFINRIGNFFAEKITAI